MIVKFAAESGKRSQREHAGALGNRPLIYTSRKPNGQYQGERRISFRNTTTDPTLAKGILSFSNPSRILVIH